MTKGISQKSFAMQSAIDSTFRTLSIHPELWAQTIRPEDTCDLRLNKITHLRAAIAAGIYCVSSADLAEKLIDHLRNNA
jgi:anti-sigma28 factor (negative regulator of flagellin synthesis)